VATCGRSSPRCCASSSSRACSSRTTSRTPRRSPGASEFSSRGRCARRAGELTEIELGGAVIYSTGDAEGDVSVAVYPWEIALARTPPDDSALNHVRGEIASIVRVGNRVRVRVGPLTAEVTAASADRLGLAAGQHVVATFKATATRVLRG